MRLLPHLFEKNRIWSEETRARDADFFERLAEQQSPRYLWIGCSDSRVLPDQIIGLELGEVFVHRNVANLVVQTDLNCLAVLQYAVDALQVEHIIICGHYSCGGVQAAAQNLKLGLIDNWLRHVQDVRRKHAEQLGRIPDEPLRLRRLCELNVIEQVASVSRTTVVQEAWERGQNLSLHGWIYGLADGLLRDLDMCAAGPDELAACYAEAIAGLDGIHAPGA